MARIDEEDDEEVINRSKIKCKFGFFVLTELSWTSKRVVVEFRDVQTRKVFRGIFDSLEMPTGEVLFDSLGTQDTIVDTTVTTLELGPAIEDALKNKRMKFRYALRGFWLSVELETSMLPSLVDKVSHSTRQGTHFVDLFLSFRPMNFMDMIQLQMSDFEGSLESMHNLQELMNEKLALCFDRVNQLSEETDTFKQLIEKYVARLRNLEGHYYGPNGPGGRAAGARPGGAGGSGAGGSGGGGSGGSSSGGAGGPGGHRKTQSAMPRAKSTAPGLARQASTSSVASLTNVPSGTRATALTTAGASKSTAASKSSGGGGHSSSASSSSVSARSGGVSSKRGSSSSTTGSSSMKSAASSRSIGGSRTPAPSSSRAGHRSGGGGGGTSKGAV